MAVGEVAAAKLVIAEDSMGTIVEVLMVARAKSAPVAPSSGRESVKTWVPVEYHAKSELTGMGACITSGMLSMEATTLGSAEKVLYSAVSIAAPSSCVATSLTTIPSSIEAIPRLEELACPRRVASAFMSMP